jgi:hypothetical protein
MTVIIRRCTRPRGRVLREGRAPETGYAERLHDRALACQTREFEARVRNPWRESKGRDGALEAWG